MRELGESEGCNRGIFESRDYEEKAIGVVGDEVGRDTIPQVHSRSRTTYFKMCVFGLLRILSSLHLPLLYISYTDLQRLALGHGWLMTKGVGV